MNVGERQLRKFSTLPLVLRGTLMTMMKACQGSLLAFEGVSDISELFTIGLF